MTFSEKLTGLRRKSGMSQEQLADRLGGTRQSVSKWEGGTAMPELVKLISLSELFGVSVDYLVKDWMEEPDNPCGGSGEISSKQADRLEKKVDELTNYVKGRVYRYDSKTRIFGLPLVSIRFGFVRNGKLSMDNTAKGIIAIGNCAIGVVAIGIVYPMVVHFTLPRGVVLLYTILYGLPSVTSFFVQAKYRLLMDVDGRRYVLSNLETATNLISGIGKVLVLMLTQNLLAMQLLYCLCSMLPIPVILWYTHKNYPWIDHHAKPDYSAVAQKNSVLMHQLSGVIFNNTDMVLLSYFCNFQLVSVYSIYNMFFVQIIFVMNLFLNSISFRMGQIFHTDRERFLGLFDLCETLYLAFVAFCYTMTAAFLLPVIRIYTSGIQDTNYIDAFLLLLFALKAVLESGKSIYHQAVQFEGAFQQTRWHALVEMAINLTITLFGIQFFGIYGCLFGTLAALLCRTVLIFRYTYRNILHQRMARPALKWVCDLGLMALILRIVGIQSRPELSLPGVIGVALLHMIWIGAAFAGAAFLFDHDLLRKLRALRSSIRS